MKNVLIVDDEKPLLLSLVDELSTYVEDFRVLTAENGAQAIEVLKANKVELVITDLKMPVMDGFELLSYMNTNHPGIPVIVMSAFAPVTVEERLKSAGVLEYVEKPLDLEELAAKILEELAEVSEGNIRGITLPAFVQLVEVERKTCTLQVESAGKHGRLYFTKGELIDAETRGLTGEDAAYEIVCWSNPAIRIDRVCRKRKRNITSSLGHILMEAFRRKDEKEDRARRRLDDALGREAEFNLDSLGQIQKHRLTKEIVMALEKHLQALKEIKGFKAAGIMNYTGEMLASFSADSEIDLSLVGATFNDIFRSAHDASRSIGLDACKETTIVTPKGAIVMRCSGVEAKAHIHMIAVIAADGNQALMKLQMEKMVAPVMAEIS